MIRNHAIRRQQGQTLIIAMIVLAVLLILGLVFVGVVNRNILQANVSRQRSVANDLAEAGIRFAHSQLVNSALGADWRPALTPAVGPGDPDADLLAPNGPDGLGPYSRVNFRTGRALIRVRYAPSDAFLFSTAPNGPLRQPGRARNFLTIESIGRVGTVNPNDPTTVVGRDRRESSKLVAFASMGITEQAMFITNRDRVSRPAEIGFPEAVGATYEGAPVSVPLQFGGVAQLNEFGVVPGPLSPNAVPFGGSLYSNASLKITGRVIANLNQPMGEAWLVNGSVRGDTDTSSLGINRAFWNAATNQWVVDPTVNFANGTTPSLDSRSSAFSTFFGLFRDGNQGLDSDGFWRSVGRKEPPSILNTDPDTGQNRYLILTRDSGRIGPAGNAGRFGHGQGVYVNNLEDRQLAQDETGRQAAGSERSLIDEWFNPPSDLSARRAKNWFGPYYIPPAANVQLLSDGFTITRNAASRPQLRTWRRPDGSDSGLTTIRFRIGDVNGTPFIINSLTPGVNINDPNPNFLAGQPFNGVLFFEGNVRIRGTIPTDRQLTLVSMGTIYIEGSITRGVVDSAGNRLNRPSRSMIGLLAREYVAVNTTMFFGPTAAENSEPGRDMLRMLTGGGELTFSTEFILNPATIGGSVVNPATWTPYIWGPGGNQGYREFTSPGNNNGPRLATNLILSHSMEDGPAPFTMVSMDVNFGLGTPANPSTYLFPIDPIAPWNSVSGLAGFNPGYVTPGFTVPNFAPIYGLGGETWQRFAQFESIALPLVDSDDVSFAFPALSLGSSNGQGRFRLLINERNDFTFRHNPVAFGATNNYLVARAAVVPHDVRIEAAIFAEEGSFVVIPGNWFNPNPNDSRPAFEANVARYQAAPFNLSEADAVLQAQRDRLSEHGAHPETPFYGEPLAVKVSIVGSVTQNMPLPMSYQSEWLRKWGWMPRRMGAMYRLAGSSAIPVLLPASHVVDGFDITASDRAVPNMTISYDPALATARVAGFEISPANPYIRADEFGRPLPPLPRLPVSPTLSYFGEVLR